MKHEDFILPACSCPECRQAGMANFKQIRDRYTGKPLHGHALRRWYEARAQCFKAAKAAVAKGGPLATAIQSVIEGKGST